MRSPPGRRPPVQLLHPLRRLPNGPNPESDLSLNEEQFQANRYDLLSRLADDLAHEIKNPLNAIIINLEVLKVRVAKDQPEAALERASVIEHETRRLHGLVDRLLQLMRPYREENGSLALDQVLDELLPLVQAQARLARNGFVYEGEAAVFVPVRRDILKFALLNVLVAVHEWLGEGGGTLRVTCNPHPDHVILLVAPVWEDGADGGARSADERALEMAAALLQVGGGDVTASGTGVEVRLPRGGNP